MNRIALLLLPSEEDDIKGNDHCFGCHGSRSPSPSTMNKNLKQDVLLQRVICKAHLLDSGEALELANGEFTVEILLEGDVSLSTIIKVGNDLQWPLTKDEPVLKLDSLNYLFSLPMKDGGSLTYGVTFLEQYTTCLTSLDLFLKENSCFSSPNLKNKNINWKEYAPKIDDYNDVLAKAIAEGTGQTVQGKFKCNNNYANKVNKGGEMILNSPPMLGPVKKHKNDASSKKNAINRSLKRVRKVSKMIEKLSKSKLDALGVATGSVMGPVMKCQAGKAFFSKVPGQVLLASLDAVNKILDAAEPVEKQALAAATKARNAIVRRVKCRYGENAGEATEDVLAAVGHVTKMAWNIFRIRKAIIPVKR